MDVKCVFEFPLVLGQIVLSSYEGDPVLPANKFHLCVQMERRLTAQITELERKLDQTNSKSRTLHNYVNFLKNSYANVFQDPSVASSTPVSGIIITSSPIRGAAHLL